MAAERKISYEEFVEDLPAILDEVARDGEVVLVEKNGQVFSIGLAESLPRRQILPRHDPEALRRAIQESAGALKGLDIDAFKAEMREMRQQDSKGRPG